MAISVNWITRVVHIPRADLVFQTSNVVTMDLEWFRWEILDIMDSDAGMANPDIINHNTSITLSGVTYARFIEIINGYSIEFEDQPGSPYAVILQGANHNVIDVNVFNTTSLLGNNSAGLIYNEVGALGDVNVTAVGGVPVSSPADLGAQMAPGLLNTDITTFTTADTMGEAIFRTRFLAKSIYVDTDALTNGDGSQGLPFDNVNDAKDEAEATGIKNIIVAGSIVVPHNLKNVNIYGVGLAIVDLNGQDINGSRFYQVYLQGTYTGAMIAQECQLSDGFALDGHYEVCELLGDMIAKPNTNIGLISCLSGIAGTGRPSISSNAGLPSAIHIRSWRGGLTIKDFDHVDDVITVGVAEGSLTFSSTCVLGTMVARGTCVFKNETLGATVFDETTHQTKIDDQHVLTKNTVIAMS